MNELALLLPLAISLVGALVVYLVSRYSEELGGALTVLTSLAALGAIGYLHVASAGVELVRLDIEVGMPFPVSLAVDSLGLFLGLITCFVWTLASLYSLEYLGERRTLFNVFLLLTLFGMLGVVMTGNLFSLLLFFELFSVASAVLVIHEGTGAAQRAGFQYLMMSVVGSVAIILAAVMLYSLTGSIDIVGTGFAELAGAPLLPVIFWLLVGGFAVKAGMFPVHVWLPEAHPIAPSPASALLSGVMIKAGAYGIIRSVFGVMGADLALGPYLSNLLLLLAVITMLLGSILAIAQTELKRLLAYSSVAQIGYVILGVALLSPIGLAGGVLHIFNHALMKGALFLAAGAIIHQSGLRNLSDLEGIGKRMPLTMIGFTLAALSMIGVPPFVGFFSKWFLAVGTLQAKGQGLLGTWPAYTVLASIILSGLLNMVYYGPIIIKGWLGRVLPLPVGTPHPAAATDGAGHDGGHGHQGEEDKPGHIEPSWVMTAPMLTLAGLTLVLGVYISVPMNFVWRVVRIYF